MTVKVVLLIIFDRHELKAVHTLIEKYIITTEFVSHVKTKKVVAKTAMIENNKNFSELQQ